MEGWSSAAADGTEPVGASASASDAGRRSELRGGDGRVVLVNGSHAQVRLEPQGRGHQSLAGEAGRATVGKFVTLHTGRSSAIGVITSVVGDPGESARSPAVGADIDLLGEIHVRADGRRVFQRGITEYPAVGDPAVLSSGDELRLVYDVSGPGTISVGQLQQDSGVTAYVDMREMLTKHFAILGTTGVGKSSGVSLILNEILDADPNVRVFLVDPHNEYGRCFGDRAQVLNPKNLRLPFWLFNFEEVVDVIFRGRPGVDEEVEILSEIIPQAKARFAAGVEGPSLRKVVARGPGYTVDTPVPYRLADLLQLIDERMGKLENRSIWTKYSRLLTRIETVRNDPRYTFMFDNANVGGDTMAEVIAHLFRLPAAGRPMTVMQLAGFPAEVVDSVVSVLSRMAFEFGLWSDGAAPLLFACEESHRYAPADRSIGFGPTRKALSRIAKEGRKYGVFLGLVTQRPSELDPTILSQCSTLFAMRMANERDQNIVRSAVSDAAASLLAFVPSLGIREVFAFGEGVALPTRLRFKELPPSRIPRSESVAVGRVEIGAGIDAGFIEQVVERWRGATMSGRTRSDAAQDFDSPGFAQLDRPQPESSGLLRKPMPSARPETVQARPGSAEFVETGAARGPQSPVRWGRR